MASQSIEGRVLTGEREPVLHAFVQVYSRDGRRLNATLSDSTGHFRIQADIDVATLVVDRLGFARVDTLVTVPTATPLTIVLRNDPVALAAITANVTAACEGSQLTPAAANLWVEIRRALDLVDWTEGLTQYSFGVVEVNRDLGFRDAVLRSDSVIVNRSGVRGAYASAPADSLLQFGFIQRDSASGEFTWYGPDAGVILSNSFQAQYCFEAAPADRDANRIGLRFRPRDRDASAQITGTLWAEPSTRSLTTLEFSYVRPPFSGNGSGSVDMRIGGRIEFDSVESGHWIVSRWLLRTARFAEATAHEPASRGSLVPGRSSRSEGKPGLLFIGHREYDRRVVRITRTGDARIP